MKTHDVTMPLPARMLAPFSIEDAQRAADEWGANCGPGALAAILGTSLDAVRPHLGDFERKRYTNPTLMYAALRSLGVRWEAKTREFWPTYGLVRVQWEGPWTAPGVPMRVRYRHTHWVASALTGAGTVIFDINCICVGGWVPLREWVNQVVPWLLRECEPKADGMWHRTHVLQVPRPRATGGGASQSLEREAQ